MFACYVFSRNAKRALFTHTRRQFAVAFFSSSSSGVDSKGRRVDDIWDSRLTNDSSELSIVVISKLQNLIIVKTFSPRVEVIPFPCSLQVEGESRCKTLAFPCPVASNRHASMRQMNGNERHILWNISSNLSREWTLAILYHWSDIKRSL